MGFLNVCMYLLLPYAVTFGVLLGGSLCVSSSNQTSCVNSRNVSHSVNSHYKISGWSLLIDRVSAFSLTALFSTFLFSSSTFLSTEVFFSFMRNGLFGSTKCFFGVILKLKNCNVLLQEQRIAGKKRENKWVWIFTVHLPDWNMFSVSLDLYLGVTAVTLRLQWHQLCINAMSLSEIVEN